jgi:hypothetical protein
MDEMRFVKMFFNIFDVLAEEGVFIILYLTNQA